MKNLFRKGETGELNLWQLSITIMNRRIYLSAALLIILTWSLNAQQEYYPDPSPVIQKRIEQWQDLKY